MATGCWQRGLQITNSLEYTLSMEQTNHDWVAIMIKEQDEQVRDENLGDLHLEKGISKKQKASVSDKGVYKGRPDAGTRATEAKNHEYKRDDTVIKAEYKKKMEDIFKQQDIEAESLDTDMKDINVEDQFLAEDERDGNFEFGRLKNRYGTASIGPETEFSDGWRADGSYTDGYWREPSAEELKEIELEELDQKNETRKVREFNQNQTYAGKRVGSQKVRNLR